MAAESDRPPAQGVGRIALQQNVVQSQYCSPRRSRLRSNLCRTATGLGCAFAISGHASVASPTRVVNSRRHISHASEPVRAAAYRDHRYLRTGPSGLARRAGSLFSCRSITRNDIEGEREIGGISRHRADHSKAAFAPRWWRWRCRVSARGHQTKGWFMSICRLGRRTTSSAV
jgi:hypothetical protein